MLLKSIPLLYILMKIIVFLSFILVPISLASQVANHDFLIIVNRIIANIRALQNESLPSAFLSCARSFKLLQGAKFASLPQMERLKLMSDLFNEFKFLFNAQKELPQPEGSEFLVSCSSFLLSTFTESLEHDDQLLLQVPIFQFVGLTLSFPNNFESSDFSEVFQKIRKIPFSNFNAEFREQLSKFFFLFQSHIEGLSVRATQDHFLAYADYYFFLLDSGLHVSFSKHPLVLGYKIYFNLSMGQGSSTEVDSNIKLMVESAPLVLLNYSGFIPYESIFLLKIIDLFGIIDTGNLYFTVVKDLNGFSEVDVNIILKVFVDINWDRPFLLKALASTKSLHLKTFKNLNFISDTEYEILSLLF
jgi:hypothetical protein